MVDGLRELERFVLATVPAGRRRTSIDPDEDLLARGTVDSLSLMEIVSFIEHEYGIEVADDELVIENFRTLASMGRYVESKRAGI